MIFNKTIFDNGATIITESLPHTQSISLGIWAHAGSRDEVDKHRGIFHLIEHMIFKGTRDRSAAQIAKDLDRIGGFSNAFTGKEQTCFYARVLNKHLKFLTQLFSDIFINSLFAPEDLELEKSVVLQEISMMEDTPDEYAQVLFDQSFWSNDSLGRPIIGTKETVSSVNRNNILDYVSRFYSPERVVIAAAGNVDHGTLVTYLRPFFESLSTPHYRLPARTVPLITPTISCFSKDLEQTHIILGAPASSLSEIKRYAEALFNTILGGNMSSRLFQEIRERRGLAYSLYSYIHSYADTGVITIYVATEKTEMNRILELIETLIREIQGGDISYDDVARAKEYLIGGILLNTENTESLMMRLARNEYVFGKYVSYEEIIKKLEDVTLHEIVDAAQRMFSAGNISLTVLGPVTREEITIDSLMFN